MDSTCPVCLGKYIGEPIALHGIHQFCTECIMRLSGNLKREHISCPLCRTTVKVPKNKISGFKSVRNGDKTYRLNKLKEVIWTGERFARWKIDVLNAQGMVIGYCTAGLGREASIRVVNDRITVFDTGDPEEHAEPCMFIWDNISDNPQTVHL